MKKLDMCFVKPYHCSGAFLIQPSATAVFEKSIQSSVELKAYSQDIGESFGSAVCISDDGMFVKNVHV